MKEKSVLPTDVIEIVCIPKFEVELVVESLNLLKALDPVIK